MPFSNPIIGGGGALVYPSIHSPDYQPGVAGWSINKDGSAEFQSITIPPGVKGATITVGDTAPPAPNPGDVWFNTSAGLLMNQWDGTSWQPHSIGKGALVAGIVVAGIIDGTTITGAQFIATGTSGEILCYSGAPALGNLVFSFSPATGIDGKGNTYGDGLKVYKGAASLQVHVNPAVNAPAIETVTGAGSESQHGSVYSLVTNAGKVNEAIQMILRGAASTFDNIYFYTDIVSAAKDGSGEAGAVFGYNDGTDHTNAYIDTQGAHFLTPVFGGSGVLDIRDKVSQQTAGVTGTAISGSIPIVQHDNTTFSLTSPTVATDICKQWLVPLHNDDFLTVYKVVLDGVIQFTATATTVTFALTGLNAGALAQVTIGSAAFNPTDNYDFHLEGTAMVANDNTALCNIRGEISDESANLAGAPPNQTSFGFTRNRNGWISVDLTSGTPVLRLQAKFGSTAGFSISSYASTFTREN